MKKQNFISRVVVPASIVVAVYWVSFIVYNNAWRIESRGSHLFLANLGALGMFLGLGLGPFLTYPMSRLRGASFRERMLAVFLAPATWAIKEVVRMTATFTVLESLYFMLNPLMVGLFFAYIADMGLLEMLSRRSLKKRGKRIKVFHAPSFVSMIVGLGILTFIFAWGLGVHSFYIFVQGYKALFGTGL